MHERADIAIIGGGVMGASIAWWLKGPLGFAGTVAVIEPDPAYTDGATGRSLGSLRQQFSTPANILMSRFGLDFVRNVGRHLAVEGEPLPDVQFREGHYLFLATERGAEALAANVAAQQETGSPVELLEPAELARRYPWINVHDIALAAIGLRDEGWLDPYALLRAFRAAALAAGADFRRDRVVGIMAATERVAALELEASGRLVVGEAVNAAGPWAGEVARMAGVALPVEPRKRTVFTVTTPDPPREPLLIIDPSGVYVRPEGAQFLTGSSPLAGEPDPPANDLEPDYAQFDERCWPALANRSPRFEALRMTGAWAGWYDHNGFDQNAVLGPHPELRNFYFANGFSGHGLQQAPAVGRALAEWLVLGESRSLDLDVFRYDRIPAGRPLIERGII